MKRRATVEFTGESSLEEFIDTGKEARIMRTAIERKLEMLGEAGRRVGSGFRERHLEVPWKEIIGLRNIIISHKYEKVNYAEIYAIVQRQIPDLISRSLSLSCPSLLKSESDARRRSAYRQKD